MDRQELKADIVKKLNAGLSIQLCSLPSMGCSRWLRDLTISGRKLIYVDAHVQPLQIGQFERNQIIEPTTVIIDHFGEILKAKDRKTCGYLRGIRDDHKYILTYLFVIEGCLDLTTESETLGNLLELATEAKAYFPGCNKAESTEVVETICKRLVVQIDQRQKDEIYDYSGGIPALIKSCVLRLQTGKNLTEFDERDRGIIRRIWEKLSQNDQQKLLHTNKDTVESTTMQQLGLLDEQLHLKSQAFKLFLSELSKVPQTPDSDKVSNQLTPIEYRLFSCLKSHPQQLCDRDSLISAGWPDDNAEGVSDEALDQAISRLRKKFTSNEFEIKTIKGRGYILQKPE